MFKKLFNKIKRLFKKLFGEGGTVDKIEYFLDNHTKDLDQLLKGTKNILLIANSKLDKIEDFGFNVPDKIQHAIKEATKEIGYWDESINEDDGFKSVIIAIANRVQKTGNEKHRKGVVVNIARYALTKLFPKLEEKEAAIIVNLGTAIFNKKNK